MNDSAKVEKNGIRNKPYNRGREEFLECGKHPSPVSYYNMGCGEGGYKHKNASNPLMSLN